MITQLSIPIPLRTPKGKAWAIALIDYGPQWDLQWITFLLDSGECWTFDNKDIRQEANYTFGIPAPSQFSAPAPVKNNPSGDNPKYWEKARRPATHMNGYPVAAT